MATKPYKARTLRGAERRVRELQKQVRERDDLLRKWKEERLILAKLAATGPAFTSPLGAMAAERIRDNILIRAGINPDGSLK